jgi:hypothetical protein
MCPSISEILYGKIAEQTSAESRNLMTVIRLQIEGRDCIVPLAGLLVGIRESYPVTASASIDCDLVRAIAVRSSMANPGTLPTITIGSPSEQVAHKKNLEWKKIRYRCSK